MPIPREALSIVARRFDCDALFRSLTATRRGAVERGSAVFAAAGSRRGRLLGSLGADRLAYLRLIPQSVGA